MKIPWSISIKESDVFVTEFDVTIECEVWRRYGEDEPEVRIEAVLVDKFDLLSATTPGLSLLADDARKRLENDPDFICQAIDQSSWWRDGPAMDPETKWRTA